MKTIFLAYIKVSSFSGQTASTVLIKDLLNAENDIDFIDVYLYPLARKNPMVSFFKWLNLTWQTVKPLYKLFTSKVPILYINVGQSYFSFFRILWWYIPFKLLRKKAKVVMSLNGYSFVHWRNADFKTYIFKNMLNSSDCVTVVGDLQREKLLEKGVLKGILRSVPNTVDVQPNDKSFILEKLQKKEGEKINILFLSLLVEKKGYPEYLEALEILAGQNLKQPIEAILCGPITKTMYCNRFKSISEADFWIDNKINQINRMSNSFSVKWIKGARDEYKKALFDMADIFILPTFYPNEAQPLVLLEAMATGSAIITTNAGEIPSTLSTKSAIILDHVSPENISKAILKYLNDPQLMVKNALESYLLFQEKFSLQIYKDNWIRIFSSLSDKRP